MPSKKRKKPWSVLIAIALAIFIGNIISKETTLFGVAIFPILDILGKLFINSLTLIVVPLVSSSIITGVARIGSESNFGRLGLKTFGFYALTNFIAILIGILLINVIKPGLGIGLGAEHLVSAETLANLKEAVPGQEHVLVKLILDVIPPNVLNAFAQGNMLGLIFLAYFSATQSLKFLPKALKHI